MNVDFLRDVHASVLRVLPVSASADGTTASISRWQVVIHREFRHVHIHIVDGRVKRHS